jgi:hypothetical protein
MQTPGFDFDQNQNTHNMYGNQQPQNNMYGEQQYMQNNMYGNQQPQNNMYGEQQFTQNNMYGNQQPQNNMYGEQQYMQNNMYGNQQPQNNMYGEQYVQNTQNNNMYGDQYVQNGYGQSVQNGSPLDKRPVWVPDEAVRACTKCGKRFNFIDRRHHCRNCGQIFCSTCSNNFRQIPGLGYFTNVRVCDKCRDILY